MEMSATAVGATTSKSREYDVFINHRGPDVKKTFGAHLCAALSSHGLRPFLDVEACAIGLSVFEEIDKALKGASVHLAVFSKGYADSKYCLDELCEMLKIKQQIIPVFYDVEARDLQRIEDGQYNNAFIKHQKHENSEKILIWKEALRKVADYNALRMDQFGNEPQLIRRILVAVQNALHPNLLPEKRYGLEKSMKDVVKTLESVSVLGLVGMGGIGKTTLAMEIYNHFLSHQHFEGYCFLRDVRSSQTSMLQEKILHDLHLKSELCYNDQEYRHTLNGALKNRRVLVIVDDISDANQFEALIPEILIIPGLDCRIVITSRRRDVLNHVMKALPATSKSVYEVQALDTFDSRHLFNIHAFRSETPREGFVELAETIADACDGLPLALEVRGKYLFDKGKPEDKEIWSEAMKVLQENPDIMNNLRVSYDGLPTNGDKEMFQDIACMLNGVKQEVAMAIWESCKNCGCGSSRTPYTSIRNLMDRSLVKLDEHDRLRMHDVLRDMGREIVKTNGVKGQALPPEKWRHLWDPAVAEKVLSRGKMNTKVRGICLSVRDPDDKNGLHFPSTLSCEALNLGNMKELHLLNLDGCNVGHNNFSSWPQQLRWLQWRFYSFRSCPSQLELPYLVVLDLSLSTQLTCLWEQNVHIMVNLAQLVVLDLSYCTNLTCLWENDAPIQLPLLKELILVDCSSLVGLPENFGNNIPRLKRLQMRGCKSLRMLPKSIGLLTKLKHLDLQECSNLTTLIDVIVEPLPLLEEMILVDCSSLVALPENFGKNVPRLKRLQMRGCESLRMLPNSIGLLTELEPLDLQECSNLITSKNPIVESDLEVAGNLTRLENTESRTSLNESLDLEFTSPESTLFNSGTVHQAKHDTLDSLEKLKKVRRGSGLTMQREWCTYDLTTIIMIGVVIFLHYRFAYTNYSANLALGMFTIVPLSVILCGTYTEGRRERLSLKSVCWLGHGACVPYASIFAMAYMEGLCSFTFFICSTILGVSLLVLILGMRRSVHFHLLWYNATGKSLRPCNMLKAQYYSQNLRGALFISKDAPHGSWSYHPDFSLIRQKRVNSKDLEDEFEVSGYTYKCRYQYPMSYFEVTMQGKSIKSMETHLAREVHDMFIRLIRRWERKAEDGVFYGMQIVWGVNVTHCLDVEELYKLLVEGHVPVQYINGPYTKALVMGEREILDNIIKVIVTIMGFLCVMYANYGGYMVINGMALMFLIIAGGIQIRTLHLSTYMDVESKVFSYKYLRWFKHWEYRGQVMCPDRYCMEVMGHPVHVEGGKHYAELTKNDSSDFVASMSHPKMPDASNVPEFRMRIGNCDCSVIRLSGTGGCVSFYIDYKVPNTTSKGYRGCMSETCHKRFLALLTCWGEGTISFVSSKRIRAGKRSAHCASLLDIFLWFAEDPYRSLDDISDLHDFEVRQLGCGFENGLWLVHDK